MAADEDKSDSRNRLLPGDGHSVNSADGIQISGHADTYGKVGGMTVVTTAVFLAGEMAGSGVLALPSAVVHSGWIGIALIVFCCCASGYAGVLLGRSWNIVQERYPEYRQDARYPYPAIAYVTFGKCGRYIVSIAIHITLLGVCAVFILLISQNLQSLLQLVHVELSFCYWLMIVALVLIPVTWLGTPKDFWPIAVGALVATFVACVLLVVAILLDVPRSISHSNPTVSSFFLAFGTIAFSFGGASTFPTIQHDMKDPRQFSKAVFLAYAVLLLMYIPVSSAGYSVYGDRVKDNVLQSLPEGGLRYAVEILINLHLLCGFVIAINPVCQEMEQLFKIPVRFSWKRCVIRTVLVCFVLLVAETVPHFGAVLGLVGGSTIALLTFICPTLCYLRLCAMTGDWPRRLIPLHERVICIEILLVGLVGGVASSIAAIQAIVSPGTFVLPCFIQT